MAQSSHSALAMKLRELISRGFVLSADLGHELINVDDREYRAAKAQHGSLQSIVAALLSSTEFILHRIGTIAVYGPPNSTRQQAERWLAARTAEKQAATHVQATTEAYRALVSPSTHLRVWVRPADGATDVLPHPTQLPPLGSEWIHVAPIPADTLRELALASVSALATDRPLVADALKALAALDNWRNFMDSLKRESLSAYQQLLESRRATVERHLRNRMQEVNAKEHSIERAIGHVMGREAAAQSRACASTEPASSVAPSEPKPSSIAATGFDEPDSVSSLVEALARVLSDRDVRHLLVPLCARLLGVGAATGQR